MGTGIEGLIWLPVAVLALGLLGALLLSLRTAMHTRRPNLSVGVVCAAWLILAVTKCGLPEAQQRFRVKVWHDCEQAYQQLPEQIRADSLFDESAGLTTHELLQLLTERGLRFVEVRLTQDDPDKIPRLTFTTSYRYGDGRWRRPGAPGSIARLSLSSTSDPRCVSIPEYQHAHTLESAPFLPNSCLRLEYVETSSAEVALTHEPARPYLHRPGSRQLVERSSGQVLARLPSAEAQGEVDTGTSHEELRQHGALPPDCRAPLPRLAELLHAKDADWALKQDRVVREVTVSLGAALDDWQARLDELPIVRLAPVPTRDHASDEKPPSLGRQHWQRQVAKAQDSDRPMPYDSQLLDLAQRRLLRLHADNQGAWKLEPVQGGFFAYLPKRWTPDERNILVRLDREGVIEWAVAVVPPPMRGAPLALSVEDGQLIIWGGGHPIPSQELREPSLDHRSEIMAVPLRALPAMR
ncbi:MAG TPA: hypothetical protein VK195_14255 [Burkholderiaceae bacterium]|nr:hypothetical protein [Burkholderiaceae bacterium]